MSKDKPQTIAWPTDTSTLPNTTWRLLLACGHQFHNRITTTSLPTSRDLWCSLCWADVRVEGIRELLVEYRRRHQP